MKGIRTFTIDYSRFNEIEQLNPFDVWGFAELTDEEKGIGAEYNYCIDEEGTNCSAIYYMFFDKDSGLWNTDYTSCDGYHIKWGPDWKEQLEKAMNEFLDEYDSDCENEEDKGEGLDMEQKRDDSIQMELTKKEFIDALEEVESAIAKMTDYAYDPFVPSEWWDGEDNYPFDKAVEDLIIPIHEWVDSCKRVVNGAAIKRTYTVVAYLSDIVPEYNGDDNLVQMDVRGKDLYQWYIVQMKDKGDCSVEAFNKWCEEHTADDTVGLYNDLKGNRCISNVYIYSL